MKLSTLDCVKPTTLQPAERDRLLAEIGGLSNPSKMPCRSWSTPASLCPVGSTLAKVKGSTCSTCYAQKGCYTFKSTREAMERRASIMDRALDTWAHHSEVWRLRTWVESMATLIADRYDRTCKVMARTGKPGKDDGLYFRWHDSGDVWSGVHLSAIAEVARLTPYVSYWLPTREMRTVREWIAEGNTLPANLIVRLSCEATERKGAPEAAKRLAEDNPTVTLSGVHDSAPGEGFEACIAYTQGGACLDCRACWDPSKNISYPRH